jgi:hypothetical protein
MARVQNPTMSDCPSLQRANASRRRAWKEMQAIRRLLEGAGAPVAPVQKPPDFEQEGAALRAALSWLLLERDDRLNRLTNAFIYFRQAMEARYSAEAQSCAREGVDALLKVAKPPAAFVEDLRALSGYAGKELDDVERRCPKVTRSATGRHPQQPPSEGQG